MCSFTIWVFYFCLILIYFILLLNYKQRDYYFFFASVLLLIIFFFLFGSSAFLFCHWLLAAPFLHLQDLARRHLIPGEALLHLQDLARRHLIPAKAWILYRLTNKSWHSLKRKRIYKRKLKRKIPRDQLLGRTILYFGPRKFSSVAP